MNTPIEPELRTLVQHLPYFVVVIDHEARFVWANHFDPTLKPAEVIGQPFDSFTAPENRTEGRAVVERCLRAGEGGYYEVCAYGQGAYEAWYGCRVVALPPDEHGRPRAMMLPELPPELADAPMVLKPVFELQLDRALRTCLEQRAR